MTKGVYIITKATVYGKNNESGWFETMQEAVYTRNILKKKYGGNYLIERKIVIV